MEKWVVSYIDNTGSIVQEVVQASNMDEIDRWCENNGYKTYSRTPLESLSSTTPIMELSIEYNPDVVAISKLANVEIAAEDYNIGGEEVDGVHYFTYDKALEVQEKLKDTGWRLPTRSEWVLICEEFAQGGDGNLDEKELYKNLNMSPTGWVDSFGYLNERTTNGYWWSSTASSATNGRNLYTWTGGVNAQVSHFRGSGFAVRLVRDVKGDE